MTEAGHQIQDNLQVPTCYPGLVYFQASETDPDAKKWSSVKVTSESKCTFSRTLALSMNIREKGRDYMNVAHWETPDGYDISFLRHFTKRPIKYSFALTGIGISGATPIVSAKTPFVAAKALLGRVFRLSRENTWGRGPKAGIWKWVENRFLDYLLPEFRTTKMEIDDWILSMPSRRRAPLQRAADNVRNYGWLERYARFSSFIKQEFLPGFSKDSAGLKRLTGFIDRLIQGPADETHVIAGPWLKPLVKALKRIWTSENKIFYGSTSPEELHKFLQTAIVDGAHQYFWCDFSMYDNTHSAESWEFIETIYRRAGVQDPLFWKVMQAWRQPSGKIGPFKYTARVMNASGRDDTALANGILNGFATYLSVAAAYLDKPLLDLTVPDLESVSAIIKLSVCGDDSLGSMPPQTESFMSRFRAQVRENVAMFGFEAKLMTSEHVEDVVYLGNRPYPVNGVWYWGRTIGRAAYKMGYSMLNKGDLMAHITGVADMHTVCSSHVPVLGDLAARIVHLREGAKRTPAVFDPDTPWRYTLSGGTYAQDTIEYVARVYSTRQNPGSPPDVQCVVTSQDVCDLIQAIEGVQRLPCMLDHWLLRRMVHVDEL